MCRKNVTLVERELKGSKTQEEVACRVGGINSEEQEKKNLFAYVIIRQGKKNTKDM